MHMPRHPSSALPPRWARRAARLLAAGIAACAFSAASAAQTAAAWVGPWRVEAAPPPEVAMDHGPVATVLIYLLWGVISLVLLYTARHYVFTLSRLLGRQRHPFALLDTLDWPTVAVLVPAHNEEAVIGGSLGALLAVDYPADRLTITVVNDRSTDGTRPIVDAYAAAYPGRITPFHRGEGTPGKAAALVDAMARVDAEIVLVFDADYLPGRDLVKRLAAPFADPEVGCVMGRVVPVNTDANLLTRLLDLERTGGYQVDQQARMNLGLVPQYGGTVGGVRREALEAVGGWNPDTLSEDTDATCRLLTGGWKVAYVNRAECYEESPETWPARIRQIQRWARGHTDVARRFTLPIVKSRHLSLRERFDGVLLMGVYAMSPILLFGWVLAVIVFYLGAHPLHGFLAALAVASYNTLGNFAAFFEIATGARLDGTPRRVRLLPLNLLGFVVSLCATSAAVVREVLPGGRFEWHKTERFRQDGPNAPAT